MKRMDADWFVEKEDKEEAKTNKKGLLPREWSTKKRRLKTTELSQITSARMCLEQMSLYKEGKKDKQFPTD